MAFDRSRSMTRPGGFILAVTLWILAGITIAVALMTLWAVSQVQDAQVARGQFEDEASLYETRDTLLYLMATREKTLAGQPTRALSDAEEAYRRLSEFGGLSREPIGGELRLDGHPYKGRASSAFSLQDEAGLFAVVLPNPSDLDRFLNLYGVRPEQWARLRDTLLDYVDPDDLTRVNGAEVREYEREGRRPPPNRRLLVPGELAMVMGWGSLPPEKLSAMIEHLTPYYAGGINPNTMPEDLLALRIPGCPETCRRLVEQRRLRPFTSTVDLQSRLAVRVPGDDALDYRYVADDTVRITLWRRTGAAWRMHVRLTPLADQQGPWSILAAYPIARPSSNEPVEQTGSPLFADKAPGE
ncbi:type II secretion system protein GspK [Stenotrophomonas acidaminiphila]|uniref:general secretion pathway protein GspK n=1 Tax=Stenotrophomonas acidaminiphila TaxID=128780 RepID=UPI0028B0464C|nr:type II secretion system protein GspK [Stenotrophomonas acidaminiphila]